MRCTDGCKALNPLGTDHHDCVVGRCFVCGTIYHGYRCNWRATWDKVRKQMVLRNAGMEREKTPPQRTFGLTAKDMKSLAPTDLIAYLKERGIITTTK